MFEKDMHFAELLDCYGDLLNEHKRNLIELYYNEDYSLSEISEQTGLTRQGVRDSIKKSEIELRSLEEKLHFAEKTAFINATVSSVLEELSEINDNGHLSAVIEKLKAISL